MANVLNVSPNRMQLMRLNQRLALARRGHRLLKDKQDELMNRFTEAIKAVRRHRKIIEENYRELKLPYLMSRYMSSSRAFIYYCLNPLITARVSGKIQRIMNIVLPRIDIDFNNRSEMFGNLNISSIFPDFLNRFTALVQNIVELTNSERRMHMIAKELEKVRRRVNALEHIFMPKLIETITYVSMQLEEMEREEKTRLMKIKDIVRSF